MRRTEAQRDIIHFGALAMCIDSKCVASVAMQALRCGARPSGEPSAVKGGYKRLRYRTTGEHQCRYGDKRRHPHDLTRKR
jgi:hypothetical protein